MRQRAPGTAPDLADAESRRFAMKRSALIPIASGLTFSCAGHGQVMSEAPPEGSAAAVVGPAAGSASFCLFEVPDSGARARRLINLGIVQYVELTAEELRIAYGGGNLGAGYEVRIAVKNREQGQG
jgi:hypothetical protein